MIKVNSKITINQGLLKRLSETQITALEKTAETLHIEVVQAQVVPRDTGALQGEKMFVDCSQSKQGKVSIVHEGPYARRLYFHPEYHFHKGPWNEIWEDKDGKTHQIKHDGNPNARGEWFKPWMPGGEHEDLAVKAFAEFYRKGAGL